MNSYTLYNGVTIPSVGFGTWQIPNEQAKQAVLDAVKAGYRHIDSAQGYGNEVGVGEGVRECGLPREEIFVTTKVLAEIKDYEGAKRSIEESLQKLNIGYIDLVLIHCPQPWDEFRSEKRYFAENREVWRAMEEAYQAGKVRAIGVSNFLEDDVANLLDCAVKPMVNQVSTYVGNTPLALIDYCRSQGILMEAYCPNGHGAALSNPVVVEMAAKYGVTPAQICVKYTLQLGTLPLPKSLNPAHIKNNLELDFTISDADMEVLKAVVA